MVTLTLALTELGDGTYRVLPDGSFLFEHPYSGYGVSMYPIERPEQLYEGVTFGVWTDPETGERHIDRTVILDAEQADLAARIGRTCAQKAIYDYARQEVLRL